MSGIKVLDVVALLTDPARAYPASKFPAGHAVGWTLRVSTAGGWMKRVGCSSRKRSRRSYQN